MSIYFDFGDLEAFLAIADTGSFQRAANRLAVSQSAVTRRIQKLETSLDSRLLERTTRSLKLTLAGRNFEERARTILAEAHEAVHALADEGLRFAYQREAVITIATVYTLTHDLLPRALTAFEKRGHTARIILLDRFANDVIEAVKQGEADFGIGFAGLQEPGLDTNVLGRDPFVLTMRRDHPLATKRRFRWTDLTDVDLIVPAKGAGNRMLIDNALAADSLPLNWRYQARHSATALQLAAAGLGAAVLPASAVTGGSRSTLAVRPLREPLISRNIALFRRSGQPMPEMAAVLRQLLIDGFSRRQRR